MEFSKADKWLLKIVSVWMVIAIAGYIWIKASTGQDVWFLITPPLGVAVGWAIVNLIETFKK